MVILTFQVGAENFAMSILTFPKWAARFSLAIWPDWFWKQESLGEIFWPKAESADALGIYLVRLFYALI